MRGKSHHTLGSYLAQRYLPDLPGTYRRAFLIGCVEPDRNPVTYLKGSIRAQWLRGHNYINAQKFMRRISRRLEHRENWRIYDYYTLGKLIHYTADAFTCAHNDFFPAALSDHREYEGKLQEHFLEFMGRDPEVDIRLAGTVMEAIRAYHRQYVREPAGLLTDSRFALNACCCVLAILFAPRIL